MCIANRLPVGIQELSTVSELLDHSLQPDEFLCKHHFLLLGGRLHIFFGIFPIDAILAAEGMSGSFRSIYQVFLGKVDDLDIHVCILLPGFRLKFCVPAKWHERSGYRSGSQMGFHAKSATITPTNG